MKATYQLSERTACDLTNISRTGYRYVAKPKNDEPLRTRLIELAAKHPGLGYLMLHGILKSEGLVVNKKRTYRLYCTAGLQMRTKKRKKLKRPRIPMVVPNQPDTRWSMDFVSDQLSNGRRLRTRQLKMNFLIQAVVLTWGKGQPLLNKSENTVRVLQPYA